MIILDMGLALKVFFTGVVGVFLVMVLLQISIQLSSLVISALSKTGDDKETSNGG